MITRILAPVDGCEQSEAVIPHVAELCNRTGSPAVLLHVFPPELHEQRPIHEQYVAQLAEQLRRRLTRDSIEVESIVLEGKPNREIADFAARTDIGLIAAAPHSQTSSGHWTVGRTADKVIRETYKPVLLARRPVAMGSSQEELLTRVLVPLDGSRASRTVLPYVEQLLGPIWQSGGGTLTLAHVVPSTHYAAGPLIARRIPYNHSEMDELKHEAWRYLEEVAAKLRDGDRTVKTVVADGDAATMVLETAKAMDANLIAMTTHGFSGFSRLFLGSVTDRVLHNASVPLLLVKPVNY
ncbi:universal stress protein [Chloroflexota bacterium]